MIEKDIVSAPIFIKLLDTGHLYEPVQDTYPQMMIEPSPCHYPQFIDSPTKKEPLCTTAPPSEKVSTPCFLFDIFCCCK